MSAILKVLLISEDRQFAFLYINLTRDKFWSISMPNYLINLMTITINLKICYGSFFSALAQKEYIQFYQGVEKACLPISHSLHASSSLQIFER